MPESIESTARCFFYRLLKIIDSPEVMVCEDMDHSEGFAVHNPINYVESKGSLASDFGLFSIEIRNTLKAQLQIDGIRKCN